jgi:peptidoglycan hydrolase-like protein with peptidoglycan-binding domain
VDGVFGQGTYDAVIRFQKKNGLRADGVDVRADVLTVDEMVEEVCRLSSNI